LWARRSVFLLENKPLLVAEIFLPTFKPYNQILGQNR
jgi:chorismate-pyruvate lyase